MKHSLGILLLAVILLTACQSSGIAVTILADGQVHTLKTSSRLPSQILSQAGLTLGQADCLLSSGSPIPVDAPLPLASSYTLTLRRAISVTLESPNSQKTFSTCALTVGQALSQAGFTLDPADFLDPPADTPIQAALTVLYQPSRELTVSVDGVQKQFRSAAATIGQALAQAGLPLLALDFSTPPETSPLPVDGQIRVTRVTETVSLDLKLIPFETRTEPSADLELDQTGLIQGGEVGLSVTRTRFRSQDGSQIYQKDDPAALIQPPQDRIYGYGTKVVIRTTTVDGVEIQYYRVLNLYATSYSPCRSGTPDGRCSYGTSSGLPVQRGTVAMVYSWYLAFGFDRLYIPGYGFATVGDVGSGPSGSHYWIDLAFSDADYQPVSGTLTVYFLAPVPKNLVYILP